MVPDTKEYLPPDGYEVVSIRFKVRGGFRLQQLNSCTVRVTAFQSALRFAVVSDLTPPKKEEEESEGFQSALRFAVVSDPTPWHAVLTSPVVVVLHTTPPHPLQPRDRTCPKWGKTPSQVPYTSEAVFGCSPTPLSEGVSKMPGRGEPGVFVGVYLGPGPVPRRGIRPRARSGLLFGRR